MLKFHLTSVVRRRWTVINILHDNSQNKLHLKRYLFALYMHIDRHNQYEDGWLIYELL